MKSLGAFKQVLTVQIFPTAFISAVQLKVHTVNPIHSLKIIRLGLGTYQIKTPNTT